MGKYICKKTSAIKPKIRCNWIECSFECKNVLEINEHIECHIKVFQPPFNSDFTCTWLTCNFISECFQEFERHLYYHGYLANLIAQCKLECNANPGLPLCKVIFSEKATPELKNDFCCLWVDCERQFASIIEFQDHVEQHVIFECETKKSPNKKNPIKYVCNWSFCKKQVDNKYRLMEHIRKHTNKKDFACLKCGDLFRTKTTFFDHLRRQDTTTQKYQCAQCFKFFSTKKFLRNHVVNHVNCFKCNLCDMTCATMGMLATHVRYRHLKDRPFKCKECDLRCVRKADLVKHVQLVHVKQVFRCDQPGCYYKVRTYNLLRRHYLEVHRNSPFIYVCHLCDKPFKASKTLSTHLIKKHDVQLGSGHKRFTYKVDENGFYRLETLRIERLEVTQQFNHSSHPFESSDATQDGSCYEIVLMTNNSDERIIVSNDSDEAQLIGEVVISLPHELQE